MLDLRTTSRENRDLVVLAIKSFALLKFYKELSNDVTSAVAVDEEDYTNKKDFQRAIE